MGGIDRRRVRLRGKRLCRSWLDWDRSWLAVGWQRSCRMGLGDRAGHRHVGVRWQLLHGLGISGAGDLLRVRDRRLLDRGLWRNRLSLCRKRLCRKRLCRKRLGGG